MTTVKNGRFQRNRNQVLDAINHFEGKTVVLTLETATKKRSLSQNGYYWAVIIPIWKKLIKEEWGMIYSKNQTHEYLRNRFNVVEIVNENTGEVLEVPRSTTENTTVEQEDYHQILRDTAKEYFNVEIPLPDEQAQLKLKS